VLEVDQTPIGKTPCRCANCFLRLAELPGLPALQKLPWMAQYEVSSHVFPAIDRAFAKIRADGQSVMDARFGFNYQDQWQGERNLHGNSFVGIDLPGLKAVTIDSYRAAGFTFVGADQKAPATGRSDFGPLALALGLGLMASLSPAMLMAVVLVDVWLFANPHLVATYTRIGARAADVRKHWFLIFFLPALVLAGVVATALAYEVAGLFTLYFIAQTYHVTRQSFGIARAFRRVESGPLRPDRLAEGLIYIFPAWGLLARCAEAPQTFLGYPIQLPPVPAQLADAMGFAALACGGWWLQRQCRAALAGKINGRHDAFVASHLCISLAAYIWIADITVGWLVVNIWHNLQYLLFVWVQNIRRDGPAQDGLATPVDVAGLWKNAARYGGVCLLLGAARRSIRPPIGQARKCFGWGCPRCSSPTSPSTFITIWLTA
jgi:hypothetical protein